MQYDSIFKPDLFKGQVQVVTGGGSGIGRCIAHELAALGATVAITGRKQEKLDTVVEEIEADGGTVTSHAFDIRSEDDVQAAVVDIVEAHGRIDGLVNNAGGQFPSPLSSITGKGFETVVRTNLTGGFLVARECYKQGMKRSGGAIVNIVADMWGGMPVMGHSGAARAGMVNLTETMAVEWAVSGVRANAVAPGWVASSGLDTYEGDFATEVIPRLKAGVPLKRLATEAEVSGAVVFLLSPAAAFISGTCMKVDGGASCNSRSYPLPDHANSEPYNGFHRYVTPRAVSAAE